MSSGYCVGERSAVLMFGLCVALCVNYCQCLNGRIS